MAKKTAVAPVYPLPIMMIAFSDDFVMILLLAGSLTMTCTPLSRAIAGI
jgi:hypothetical protein